MQNMHAVSCSPAVLRKKPYTRSLACPIGRSIRPVGADRRARSRPDRGCAGTGRRATSRRNDSLADRDREAPAPRGLGLRRRLGTTPGCCWPPRTARRAGCWRRQPRTADDRPARGSQRGSPHYARVGRRTGCTSRTASSAAASSTGQHLYSLHSTFYNTHLSLDAEARIRSDFRLQSGLVYKR